MYTPPQQQRAIESERRFLESMNALLKSTSYSKLSIEMIAAHSHLHKGAFLNRFGSKKQALFLLFKQYCDDCNCRIDQMNRSVPHANLSLSELCMNISATFEELLVKHFSSNRAMYECFAEELEVHELTKSIFKRTVAMMISIQKHYKFIRTDSHENAFAATQLLVTINFNSVMKAMPGLPIDSIKRHRLIGKMISEALTFE